MVELYVGHIKLASFVTLPKENEKYIHNCLKVDIFCFFIMLRLNLHLEIILKIMENYE